MTDIIGQLVAVVLLTINGAASTTTLEPAVRLDPPVIVVETTTTTIDPASLIPQWDPTSQNGACVGAIPLLEYWNPGWDVARMSRIMYRESRCQPEASNSCCSGLLQMHRMHIPRMAWCGVYTRDDYYDPVKNICAAAVLYGNGGIQHWAQTS